MRSSCGLQRELRGDVDDEVGLALLDHLVDDVRGARAQRLLEQPDHAGREALVDEQPVPGVLGRVHFEHDHATCRVRLLEVDPLLLRTPSREDLRASPLRREQRGVTVDRDDVLVLHHVPESLARPLLVPEHGRLVAQALEPLVVLHAHERVGIEQVDVAQVGARAGHGVLLGVGRGVGSRMYLTGSSVTSEHRPVTGPR